MTKIKIINGKKAGAVMDVNEPNKNVRQILAWVAAAFVDERAAVSETIFHGDEIESPLPKGKAVKVTFELVDHVTCSTCGGDLPL